LEGKPPLGTSCRHCPFTCSAIPHNVLAAARRCFCYAANCCRGGFSVYLIVRGFTLV
jgi:hypothetical protein